jgi:hypothetical protein
MRALLGSIQLDYDRTGHGFFPNNLTVLGRPTCQAPGGIQAAIIGWSNLVERPNWKQHAQTALPLAIAAGLVAAISGVPHGLNDPASLALIRDLGVSLAASGLAALCKPSRLFSGKEYTETLANHDISRLIRIAWGEAAVASLRAYVEAHPAPAGLTITQVYPSPAFVKGVESIKPEDFVPQTITVSTVHSAIEESRRALLRDPDSPYSTVLEGSAREQVDQLKSALIDSVVDTISRKLGSDVIPPDLRAFLDRNNPTGILGQLCMYVAFQLKTDHRAQVAVLHYTLQRLSDQQVSAGAMQQRIEKLCQQILNSQNEFQENLLRGFQERIQRVSKELDSQIDQAFNRFVCPRLDAPFATSLDGQAFSFTYRARMTPFLGRETAMDALIQFMGDPRPGLWTVISGPAGSGKSRLAAELIAMVVRDRAVDSEAVTPPGQWRAGFLHQSDGWLLKGDAAKWSPDADTLIVIDYAGELDRSGLSDFLAQLGRSRELLPECRVRVILIDRLSPDSELGLAKRLLRGSDQGEDAPWTSTSVTAEISE